MAQVRSSTLPPGAVLETSSSDWTVPLRRVSWGAVFAGTLIALVIQIMLGILGTAIGLSTLDPLEGESPTPKTFSTVAGLWWVISSWLALFAGGWIAGHLAGVPRQFDAMLHGLLVWALGSLVALYVAGSVVSSITKGVAGVIGTTATVVGTGAAAAAPQAAEAAKNMAAESGISMDDIKRDARALLTQSGKSDTAQSSPAGGAADSEFNGLLDRVLSRGKDAAAVDREALVNLVMTRMGVPREEAVRRVEAWETNAAQARAKMEDAKAQAKQKARESADAAAKYASLAALFGFVALLLGAIAAGAGGAFGRPEDQVAV